MPNLVVLLISCFARELRPVRCGRCGEIPPFVSVLPQAGAGLKAAIQKKDWDLVRNPVALAVYTFSHSRYMFPVLLELAIVPVLP